MTEVVIGGAVRTAIGRFSGTLSTFKATQLGAIVVKELVKRTGVNPEAIDEIIMGNVVGAGIGQNPARQAALFGGLPDKIAAMTINKVCGSGLRAVSLAAQTMKAGDAHCTIAGGLESMSNAPYMLDKARNGYRMGNGSLIDLMIHDGLWDVYNDFHMGNTGELIADKFGIKREEQDEYAANSHAKAVAAIESGKMKSQIVPVPIPQKKGDPIMFDTDESPRKDTTKEALAKLKPAFKKDGTVTAGNAPGVNDGAAALLVLTTEKAKEFGIKPLCKIRGYATSGVEPKWLMMAPVLAVEMVLEKTGLKKNDIDAFELNEAFSVQAIACCNELGIDFKKVNKWGGAVALGHPIGATGAMVLTKLINILKDEGKSLGCAALCLGGGNAVSMIIEML
jgi:acetyl-CoA C-acetyltransferase